MEEMQSEIEKIKELSEAVQKTGGLEDLLDKIAVTNKKLEDLQSREDATDMSGLQCEVVAIKKEVEELSRKVDSHRKQLIETRVVVNQLQHLIPKIDSLQGLREDVAGINKKLQSVQKAITSLEKRNSDANKTICNDRGVLNEIEHVEYELRREFQTELRCLRESAERDKKELYDRLLAQQIFTRKLIAHFFLKMVILMVILILLSIRFRAYFDPFLDIIFLFFPLFV